MSKKLAIHALQAQLGSTLDKLTHLPPPEPTPAPVAPEPGPKATAKKPAKPLVIARGKRTSVNLFDSDLELLDPLRDFLRKKTGVRVIRDSTLVQVLCRAYDPSEASVTAFRAVTALDQRRKA